VKRFLWIGMRHPGKPFPPSGLKFKYIVKKQVWQRKISKMNEILDVNIMVYAAGEGAPIQAACVEVLSKIEEASLEKIAQEVEGKKKTWARDTVMLRKEEVLEAPLSLEFRGDSKPYTIVELEDLLGDGE